MDDVKVKLYTKNFRELNKAFLLGAYYIFVLEGGSRSSKTHSIIQFWIWYAEASEGTGQHRVAICRLKLTWLKATVLEDFINVLKDYEIYEDKAYNKSNLTYQLYDTKFCFIGLDDTQKLAGFKCRAFWFNEAVEADKNDYEELMQRLEDDGFCILDYNPVYTDHWIKEGILVVDAEGKLRKEVKFIHSTWRDNRLISKRAKEQILGYEPTPDNIARGTANKRKWQVYGLGLPAALEGIIFDPDRIEIVKEIPYWISKRGIGLDFGFTNDPTACIEAAYDPRHNILYGNELIYEPGLLTIDLINKLKDNKTLCPASFNNGIIADSADPRLIAEIQLERFNIEGADKPAGSVQAGIDKMQGMKLCITERSLNLKRELSNYVYMQNKKGRYINKPQDGQDDHLIDAWRYWVYMNVLGENTKRQFLHRML